MKTKFLTKSAIIITTLTLPIFAHASVTLYLNETFQSGATYVGEMTFKDATYKDIISTSGLLTTYTINLYDSTPRISYLKSIFTPEDAAHNFQSYAPSNKVFYLTDTPTPQSIHYRNVVAFDPVTLTLNKSSPVNLNFLYGYFQGEPSYDRYAYGAFPQDFLVNGTLIYYPPPVPQANTPLPPTALMFASGLLSFGAFRKKNV